MLIKRKDIKVKLKDSKKCEGCPMITYEGPEKGTRYIVCELGYFEQDPWQMDNPDEEDLIRPKKCIKKHGL